MEAPAARVRSSGTAAPPQALWAGHQLMNGIYPRFEEQADVYRWERGSVPVPPSKMEAVHSFLRMHLELSAWAPRWRRGPTPAGPAPPWSVGALALVTLDLPYPVS